MGRCALQAALRPSAEWRPAVRRACYGTRERVPFRFPLQVVAGLREQTRAKARVGWVGVYIPTHVAMRLCH
jgi:hypothetical protein